MKAAPDLSLDPIENEEKWKTLLASLPLPSFFANPVRFQIDAENCETLVGQGYAIDDQATPPGWSLAYRATAETCRFSVGPVSLPLPVTYRLSRTIANSVFWKGEGDLPAVIGQLSDLLSERCHKVHLHYFRLPYETAFDDLTQAAKDAGLRMVVSRGMPLYRCSLDRDAFPLPSRRLKSKTRNTLSRKQKKMEAEHGAVRVERYTELSQADAFFEAVETLSPHTWQRHSGMGGLRDNKRFRRVYQHESEAGRMRSYLLFAGDRPIAYQFGTAYDGVYHYEILGFDAAFSDYSPGQLLRLHSFDELYEDGLATIDFGPGEYEYKSQWGTEQFELFEIRLYGKTLRSKLLWLVDKTEALTVTLLKKLRKRRG